MNPGKKKVNRQLNKNPIYFETSYAILQDVYMLSILWELYALG